MSNPLRLQQHLNEVRDKLRRKQYYSAQQIRAFRRLRNKLLRAIDKLNSDPNSLAGERHSATVSSAFRVQQLTLNL